MTYEFPGLFFSMANSEDRWGDPGDPVTLRAVHGILSGARSGCRLLTIFWGRDGSIRIIYTYTYIIYIYNIYIYIIYIYTYLYICIYTMGFSW